MQNFKLNRRSLITTIGTGLMAASLPVDRAAQAADKSLRLLTWEGYADEPWVKEFEAKTGATVKISYTGSVDEIFAKLGASAGQDYDVIAVETSSYKRLVQERLLQPLDKSKLPSVGNLAPAFQNVPAITFGDKLFAAPFAWGSIPLVYSKTAFPTAPDSWALMWDEKYKGRVIAMDDATNQIVTTALLLGIKDPFNFTDDDFTKVKQKLLDQKRFVATYYAGFDDGVSIFAQGGVDLLMSMGEPQAPMLNKKGVDVGLVIPKEGAIGWIDCWTISAGARDPALAHQWVDFMLDRRIGTYISEKTGYGNTTNAEANGKIGLNYADKLVFLQAPEDQAKRIDLWNEVKGDTGPVTSRLNAWGGR